MKQIQISISLKEVLASVALQTAYAGNKTEGGLKTFERVATIGRDSPLLLRYWREACGSLADNLRGFIAAYSLTEDALRVTLETSGAYDDAMTPSLTLDIFESIWAKVTARWCDITLPDKARDFHRQADSATERAVSKLCHRKKPVRKVPS
ncbi:MAG: hypothetical protein J1D77_08630 [Muribaculaceae bacterium]|nr:hypothetical protein [Muribaculaceae bacterium]